MKIVDNDAILIDWCGLPGTWLELLSRIEQILLHEKEANTPISQ